MTTRSLDINGDISFGKGSQNYLTDLLELQQNIKTKLLMFQDDCFFANEEGIDWYNLIGEKGIESEILSQVKNSILSNENVNSIIDLQFNLDDNRNFSITYKINTKFGITNGGINI